MLVLLMMGWAAPAQDTVGITHHTYMMAAGTLGQPTLEKHVCSFPFIPISVPFNPPLVSIKYEVPQTYTYHQGKLPVFCALEDRIWRRTNLGMQFRLTDKPMGNR